MKFTIDDKKLRKAIRNNPKRVAKYTKVFLYRSLKELERKTGQSPWKVGQSGGGSPVATGNLLRSHKFKLEPFRLTYYQDDRKADYGKYIHGGTRYMRARPWMSWVQKKSVKNINNDAVKLLKEIVEDLGK